MPDNSHNKTSLNCETLKKKIAIFSHIFYYYNDEDYWLDKLKSRVFRTSGTPYQEAYKAYNYWVTGGDETEFYKICADKTMRKELLKNRGEKGIARFKTSDTNSCLNAQGNQRRSSLAFDFSSDHFDAALSAMLSMIDNEENAK